MINAQLGIWCIKTYFQKNYKNFNLDSKYGYVYTYSLFFRVKNTSGLIIFLFRVTIEVI